jgi:hypothetical protein
VENADDPAADPHRNTDVRPPSTERRTDHVLEGQLIDHQRSAGGRDPAGGPRPQGDRHRGVLVLLDPDAPFEQELLAVFR